MRAEPAPLSYPEIERLFATVERPDPTARHAWPARDVALCATFLATGVRLAEALAARVGDVQALDVAPRLRVLGKGARTRTVPLHDEAAGRIRAYLTERTARLGDVRDDALLFVCHDGSAFSPAALRRLVERWYARAGVRRHPGAAVHALRHTWATTRYEATGADADELERRLGHRSQRYIARYTNPPEDVAAGYVENL